jgi:hypothetical protein
MGIGANVFEHRFDSAERVVRVAGTGGVAGGGMVGVASAGWLRLLFPRSVPLSM